MLKSLVALAACSLCSAAFAAAPMNSNGTLVDASGKTLYTFDKDTTPGKSACSGGCAKAWPAAMADSADQPAGDFGIIAGADGMRQWTFKGHPLYRYAKDAKAGDTKGDGFKDMWHTVKP